MTLSKRRRPKKPNVLTAYFKPKKLIVMLFQFLQNAPARIAIQKPCLNYRNSGCHCIKMTQVRITVSLLSALWTTSLMIRKVFFHNIKKVTQAEGVIREKEKICDFQPTKSPYLRNELWIMRRNQKSQKSLKLYFGGLRSFKVISVNNLILLKSSLAILATIGSKFMSI